MDGAKQVRRAVPILGSSPSSDPATRRRRQVRRSRSSSDRFLAGIYVFWTRSAVTVTKLGSPCPRTCFHFRSSTPRIRCHRGCQIRAWRRCRAANTARELTWSQPRTNAFTTAEPGSCRMRIAPNSSRWHGRWSRLSVRRPGRCVGGRPPRRSLDRCR